VTFTNDVNLNEGFIATPGLIGTCVVPVSVERSAGKSVCVLFALGDDRIDCSFGLVVC
jgi:hypothetical protein